MSATTSARPDRTQRERTTKRAALVLIASASVATLLIDGELELALFMAVTVMGSLAAFDVALDRSANAFLPWILVSSAMLGKAVPTVISRLADSTGSTAERLDHIGAVLFGGCLAVVALLLARPGSGQAHRERQTAIVTLAGLIAAVGGASAAFGGVGRFGNATAARVFETIGWGTVGVILAGAAIAAGGIAHVTSSLAILSGGLAAGATIAAAVAAGEQPDLGWWAITFAILSLAPLLFRRASLGRRSGRTPSMVPLLVSIVFAVLGVQAALLAAGDDGTWSPGRFILPIFAVLLLALGLPLYRWAGGREAELDREAKVVFDMLASSQVEETPELDQITFDAPTPRPGVASLPPLDPVEPFAETTSAPIVSRTVEASAFSGAIGGSGDEQAIDTAVHAEGRSEAAEPTEPLFSRPPFSRPPFAVGETAASSDDDQPAPDAAAALDVPAPETELDPHLVDPGTGLRSAAGLQELLIAAFGSGPRSAAEVSIVMVAVRDLDRIEESHGRIAAATAMTELGRRLDAALPAARTSRFTADGFAALIEGPRIDQDAMIARATDALLDLLEPVDVGGSTSLDVDLVASMAQCYDGEDVAGFVGRANDGLQRAVVAAEPTLIAMP
ncbi:MAG: hypothetical protein AAF567_14125 [Actinomycetota bacterium]